MFPGSRRALMVRACSCLFVVSLFVSPTHADTTAGVTLQRRTLGTSLGSRVEALRRIFDRMEALRRSAAGDTFSVESALSEINAIEAALKAVDEEICGCCDEMQAVCSTSPYSSVLLARLNEMEGRYHEGITHVLEGLGRLRDILTTQISPAREEVFLNEVRSLLDYIRGNTKESPKIKAGGHSSQPSGQDEFGTGPIAPAFSSPEISRQYQVYPEDLKSTIDANITSRIQRLADELNRDPVAIYNYVKGNIDFEPYAGSKKGAEGTLIEKAGNAVDHASLLIALYRSIGIPCRYLRGTIRLSVTDAMNWLNAETVEGLMSRASVMSLAAVDKSGKRIPNSSKGWVSMTEDERRGVVRDIAYLDVTHTWIEAYLPYFNYRGQPSPDASQKFWIQLDPSFKRYGYQSRPADALSKIGFSEEELLAEYLNADTRPSLDVFLVDRVADLLQQRSPDRTVADIMWERSIVAQPVTQLPNGLDSGVTLIVITNEWHDLPENGPPGFIRRVTISVDGITKTFRTPELYNKRITISFRPATAPDEDLLNKAGGDLLRVSPLYEMVTELKIEGRPVGVGTTPRRAGDRVPYKFSTEPASIDRAVTVTAGGFYAVSVNMGYVPAALIQERYERFLSEFAAGNKERDAVLGEMMYLAACQYWHRMQTRGRTIGGVLNVLEITEPSAAMVRVDIKAFSHFGVPSDVEVNSLVIDVPWNVRDLPRASGKDILNYQKLQIVHGSVFEHVVFDEMFGVQSLSTIKILQLARSKGIEIVQITRQNKEAQLERLRGNIPDDDFAAISDEANRPGLELLLTPLTKQIIGSWEGTGWLVYNPRHGFGAIISGKPFGGASITALPFWLSGPTHIVRAGGGILIPPPEFAGEVPPIITWGNVIELTPEQVKAWVNGTLKLPETTKPMVPTATTEPPPVKTPKRRSYLDMRLSFLESSPLEKPKDPRHSSRKTELDKALSLGSTIGKHASDPVDVLTGQFFNEEVDLVGPGRMPIVIKRIYKSRTDYSSFLGHGWMFGYDAQLFFKDGNIILSDYDGGVLEFVRQGSSNMYMPTPAANPGYVNETVNGIGGITSPFSKRIDYDPTKDAFVYTDGTREKRRFVRCAGSDTTYLIHTIENAYGDSLAFTCDETARRIVRIENSSGNFVTLHYDVNRRLREIVSSDGRRVEYQMGTYQDLVSVVNPNGEQTSYEYGTNDQSVSTHRLISVRRPGNRRVDNEYDTGGRVVRQLQTFGNNATPVLNATFTYNADNTIVTDFAGKTTTYFFDTNKRITRVVDATNASVSKTWDEAGNLTSVTDANNRATMMTHDAHGNILTSKDAKGGVTTYTYHLEFHKVTSVIDANGHKTEFVYDPKGNLIEEKRFTGTAQTQTAFQPYSTTTHTHDQFGQRTSTTEPEGGVSRFEYDGQGNIVRVTDALGKMTTHTYDQRGNRTSTTDALGNVTNVEYDILNRPTAAVDPLGGRAATTFDANGNVLTATNPNGQATTSMYDYADRQLTVTDALGGVTKNEYSQSNKLIASIDPRGNTTRFFYDDVYRLARVQDAPGGVTTREYEPSGNVVNEIDARGNTVQHVYDELNRRIRTIDAEGNAMSVEYDAIGNVTARVDGKGNRTTYFYDELNRLAKVTDALGQSEEYTYNRRGDQTTVKNKRGFVTTFEYGLLRRLVKQTNPDGSIMRYEYDALGRRTAVIDNNGNRTETVYDKNGRVISVKDALGNVTTYAYDPNGNRVSQTDANGNVITFTYDALDRLTSKTEGGNITTQYVYDPNGNQIAVVDANGNRTEHTFDGLNRRAAVKDAMGAVTRYTLDANGNQTDMTNANNNTWRTDFDKLNRVVKRIDPLNNTEEMVYDPAGILLARKDGKGHVVVHEFDALNRLVRKKTLTTLFVTVRDRSWLELKDLPGHVFESYTFDQNGNRLTMTDSTGLTTSEYDNMDRLVTQSLRPVSLSPQSAVLITRYSYDGLGNRRVLEYPDGKKVFYDFDKLNRLATVKDNDGAVTCRTTYDAVGNLRTKLYANSTLAEYQYDNLYRVTSVTNKRLDGSVISRFDYQYDAVGNRLRQVETNGGQTNVTVYTYDQTYRLTLESDNKRTVEYFFDAVGNRIKTITNKDTIDVYAYNERNELLTITSTSILSGAPSKITTFTYDANGNTIRKQSPTTTDDYRYDFKNRLVSVVNDSGTLGYTYNGDNRRVEQIKNGVKTVAVFDARNIIAEFSETGVFLARTVFGVSGPIVRGPPSSERLSFYHVDALNSVVNLTDQTGATVATYSYDAYGNVLSENESPAHRQPYRFIARQYERQSDLYDLRRRWYSARTGRFLTQDPFLGTGYDPRTLHRYLYSYSSPLRYYDPTGYTTAALSSNNSAMNLAYPNFYGGPGPLALAPVSPEGARGDVPLSAGPDPGLVIGYWNYRIGSALPGTAAAERNFNYLAGVAADPNRSGVVRTAAATGAALNALWTPDQALGTALTVGTGFYQAATLPARGAVAASTTADVQLASRSGSEIMQQLTTNAAERLAQNPALARTVLSPAEYAAGQASSGIAKANYGKAIERVVAQDIRSSPELSQMFEHLSRPGQAVPDFAGRGAFEGMTFDITTPGQVQAHLARPYGTGLNITTYERPLAFTTFPR